jgi:hypothetical protein
MISHQHEQNVIDGKKTINLFPAAEQHRDKDSTFLFEEGDVFGLDVLLTTGEETKVSKPLNPVHKHGSVLDLSDRTG